MTQQTAEQMWDMLVGRETPESQVREARARGITLAAMARELVEVTLAQVDRQGWGDTARPDPDELVDAWERMLDRAGGGVTECLYCGCDHVPSPTVPDVDDDDAWATLSEHHADDCEWILTRAHRMVSR